MNALKNNDCAESQNNFDIALTDQISVLRDNIIKRSLSLGINNPRQLWLKTQELRLDIASSYVSRLWKFNGNDDESGGVDIKQPNFSMSKLLVLSVTLECSLEELLSDRASLKSEKVTKLSFSGDFHDKMVAACAATLNRLVAMERIAIIKPLNSEDVVDLQFSSFNEIR